MAPARNFIEISSLSEDAMAYERKRPSLDWLALWIVFSAWSSLSGWVLSYLSELNPAGIVCSYLLFAGGVIVFRSHFQASHVQPMQRIFRSRFFVPKLWLLLAILAFVGGLAYAPNNYDYLTYRFSRVLNWSADRGWSWISTVNDRMNYSGTGFEWLMVPPLVLFKTDRLFFLINFVSYLFLPGLVFAVFSRLGVSRRISWWWMWIFPCGYCYILQAASAGNDSIAAVYLLAALFYLFKAQGSAPSKNLLISCLAIALMTGVKASNLPLALPWLILFLFHGKDVLAKVRPAFLALIFCFAAPASFLPTALLNIHYTGDFAGDPHNTGKMKLANPMMGVAGNLLQMANDNLEPPVFPGSVDWRPLLPADLKADLLRDFPRLGLHWGELQIEEEAGVGLGIVFFAGLFILVGIRARMSDPSLVVIRSRQAVAVLAGALIAWLAYLGKMGSEATSRLIAAYYPLLIACVLVLVSLDGRSVRRRIFDWVGVVVMLSAFPLVILSPARPLFPVESVADLMSKCHAPAGLIERYNQVYQVYAGRAEAFKEFADTLPASERVVGFLQRGNDPAASLWRPFGSKKVIEVTPDDSAEKVKAEGICFVVVGQDALDYRYQTTATALAAKWSASVVKEKNIVLTAHRGPETWYLLSL